jgi:regulator of sirC expression with transglutaminase-like and TPR domain
VSLSTLGCLKALALITLGIGHIKVVEATTSRHIDAFNFIEKTLSRPSSEIDLARTKLTIDQFVDPSINIEQSLEDLNRIAQTVHSASTPDMTAIDRMMSLRAYLYEGGYWNQFNPYQYDFNDPLGTKLHNQLLPTYLSTKKGNCISMPFLFIVLAEKLGLDVTVATAPLHVFVKFKDPMTGQVFNLETTNGAKIENDNFYNEMMPMTDTAIKNGVYLKSLNKKETVAVMTIVLSEYYAEQKQWQNGIDIVTLILKYYPNYAYAMLKLGNFYSDLLQEKVKFFRAKGTITKTEKEHLDDLHAQNQGWFTKAEAIGWQPVSPDTNAKYMRDMKQRANNQQHR